MLPTTDGGIPIDQAVNPDENPAPSQAALDQPDLGGGILQAQAADAATKFDPTVNTVDDDTPDALVPDPQAEQFPGVDTNPLNLGGQITQETILRLDVLRLAATQNEPSATTVERAAAYWKWINENA